MFYDNRRKIYLVIIMFALVISFFCGKKIGSGKVIYAEKTPEEEKPIIKNLNYNNILNVKGTDYTFDYSITNAFFEDKTTLNFNVSVLKKKNVQTIKIIAKDQDNNVLEVSPNASSDPNILTYTTKLNDNTTKVNLTVYPLTKKMSDDKKLNYNTISNQNSTLVVELIKKEQIEKLQ